MANMKAGSINHQWANSSAQTCLATRLYTML